MALERSNPLPPGSYWVDVPPSDAAAFDAWLRSNAGALRVVATSAGQAGWQWIRFDVEAPAMVFWQGPGFPTIAVQGGDLNEQQVKQSPRDCHVVMTEAGPQVVCNDGADRVDLGAAAGEALRALAPWALAGLFGVVLIKRVTR